MQTPKPAVRSAKGPSLPWNPSTKPLSFKMPKGRKEVDINARLKKKSPWFSSIVDPLHGADCKIPDETGVETGTTQLVQRYTISSNAQGICGFKIWSPYVNDVNIAGQVDLGGNLMFIGPTATSSTLVWGSTNAAGGTWTAALPAPFDGINELQQITNQHRIVSASFTVQPEPSLATNQGEYVLFLRDFEDDTSTQYNDYMNSYKSVVIPINSSQAGTVRWYPVERQFCSFKSFFTTVGTIPITGSNDMDNQCFPLWNLGMLASGLDTSTVFRITVVINYEFIPIYNVLNVVDASPSPQDATEVDLVENWVQDVPLATPISQIKASSSPSTVSPQHGENDQGTGFGMLYNVIAELAPIAMALL